MARHRAPQNIFDLFSDPVTAKEGRRQAVEWAKTIMSSLKPGDVIIIPDGHDGHDREMTYMPGTQNQ